MSTLRKNGISNYSHSARKISVKDFDEFDYVFAMDRSNLRDIEALRKRAGKVDARAKVMLFGEFAGSDGGKSKRRRKEDLFEFEVVKKSFRLSECRMGES